MTNYEEVRVNLTNSQLCKLKSTAKNKTGATLRITKKYLLRWGIASCIISNKKTKN